MCTCLYLTWQAIRGCCKDVFHEAVRKMKDPTGTKKDDTPTEDVKEVVIDVKEPEPAREEKEGERVEESPRDPQEKLPARCEGDLGEAREDSTLRNRSGLPKPPVDPVPEEKPEEASESNSSEDFELV